MFNFGCTCESCNEANQRAFLKARKLWDEGTRIITFDKQEHICSDGCCDEEWTNVYVNEYLISVTGDSASDVAIAIMEFLEIKDVVVAEMDEDRDQVIIYDSTQR